MKIKRRYRVVNLNPGIRSRADDLKMIEQSINQMVEDGYTLQHVVSPNDIGGVVIGIFYKDEEI